MRKSSGTNSLKRAIVAAVSVLISAASHGAGQRDAPSVLFEPGADVSDVYTFRSWVNPANVALIMNVVPMQEPGDAPMYFTFDDSVLYRIHVDNDRDGVADDVVYEFRFTSQDRSPLGEFNFMEPYVGNPAIPIPALQGITALDGPGSEGITRRQTYTVTEVRHGVAHLLFRGRTLVSVPSNVGPNTFPDYEAVAAKGIYTEPDTGIRVFAGQRAETFYGDTSALFDSGNVRGNPLLTAEQDADDHTNPFGLNHYAGFNVNTISVEVPISRLTLDGKAAEQTRQPLLGVYASTSRSVHRLWHVDATPWDNDRNDADLIQIDRMANPMISWLLIDTPAKDRWVRSKPEQDAQFQYYFQNPSPTRYPTTPYIFKIPSPPPPRADLMQLFLKYPGQPLDGQNCGRPCSDLLRLNVQVAPTLPAKQSRLGALLGTDPAGMPNGRRPNDDAIDFGLRVIGGPVPIALRLSDGVNFVDGAPGAGTSDGMGYGSIPGNHLDVTTNGIAAEFPYLPSPYQGRDHTHTP
jgi:hypothetical protein